MKQEIIHLVLNRTAGKGTAVTTNGDAFEFRMPVVTEKETTVEKGQFVYPRNAGLPRMFTGEIIVPLDQVEFTTEVKINENFSKVVNTVPAAEKHTDSNEGLVGKVQEAAATSSKRNRHIQKPPKESGKPETYSPFTEWELVKVKDLPKSSWFIGMARPEEQMYIVLSTPAEKFEDQRMMFFNKAKTATFVYNALIHLDGKIAESVGMCAIYPIERLESRSSEAGIFIKDGLKFLKTLTQ